MKYIVILAACFLAGCTSTDTDWSELMRRDDISRIESYNNDMPPQGRQLSLQNILLITNALMQHL